MANNSCAWAPHVSKNGKPVPSELFQSVSKFHIRRTAVDWYGIATDEEFIRYLIHSNSVKAKWDEKAGKWKENEDFDRNGQLRHKTLRRIMKESRSDFMENLAKSVWKQFNPKDDSTLKDKDGIFTDYNDAVIGAILDFNRKSPFKTDYMATIEWNESKNKYEFKLVRKYKSNVEGLIETNEIFNLILNFLKEHGVDVLFLKEDIENRQQGGRYSTIGANKVADELTSLITLCVKYVRERKDGKLEAVNPSGEDLKKLAEEAGHFIIGSLGNNKLVQRLLDRVRDPEVRKDLLGEDYEDAVLGTDEMRDIAGRLVGDALIGYLKELRAYGNWYYTEIWDLHILLSRRIADFAIKITARRIARKIVELPSSSFDLDTALKTQETFSTQASANMKTYRCMVSALTAALEKLRAASKKAYDDHLEELARITEELVRIARNGIADQRTDKISANAGTIFGRMTVLERIADALLRINKLLTEKDTGVADTLKKIVISNDRHTFSDHLVEYSERLNRARIVIDAITALRDELARAAKAEDPNIKEDVSSKILNTSHTKLIVQIKDPYTGASVDVNIAAEINKITEILDGRKIGDSRIEGLTQELHAESLEFATRFMEATYGWDFVRMSLRLIVWNTLKNKEEDVKRVVRVKYYDEKNKLRYRDYTKSALLLYLRDGNISFWRMFIASMSNNPDVISNKVWTWGEMLRDIGEGIGDTSISNLIFILIVLIFLIIIGWFPIILICGYIYIVLRVMILHYLINTKRRSVKFCYIILSVLGFIGMLCLCDLFNSRVEKITGIDIWFSDWFL